MPELVDLQINEICASLQSEDKFKKKKALQKILTDFFDGNQTLDETCLLDYWEIFHRPLVRILHDQMEACRDLAIEILKKFLLSLPCSDKNIVYIIPIMTKRLGCQELIEQSEEVRLKCILLLRSIVLKYKEKLLSYFDDLVTILTRTVTDKYPDVKKESCKCICEVANAMPSNFYAKSENFIKPILFNISHQHYKIRMSTVVTIGEVFLIGNNKSMDIAASSLAERLFDQSAAVRTAVVEVAGKWMVNLKDRYSWWYKLIPLLLTGINDVIPEIREKASNLWLAAGKQYIKENESDQKFKDKLDYSPEYLSHYPPNIIRPNLGCRTIAQQNLCKLVAAISRELHDWMADIKLRAAQLLCILALNVEEEVVAYIPKLLSPMYRACNDEDNRVVENVELAAEYMGYFVPPNMYCDFIMPTLQENPTAGHFKILAAILRGSSKDTLSAEMSRISNFLQENNICQNQKPRYQMEILNCCRSLLNVCIEECSKISRDLFKIIFTILSISAEVAIENNAKDLLKLLAKVELLKNVDELYDEHLIFILKEIQNASNEIWTVESYEFYIFQACITHAKFTTYKNLNLIHPIFEQTTNDSSDKKIKLKQYIILSNYLQHWDKPLDETIQKDFNDFANIILERVIISGLQCTGGRSAEAIRTASMCCLCTLLSKIVNNYEYYNKHTKNNNSVPVEYFEWLFEKLNPILMQLIEDDVYKTRLYCLQAICFVINIAQNLSCLTIEHIHKLNPEIITRLEDQHDAVRLAAIDALREIWKVLPKDYDLSFYYVHIEYAYIKILAHLDDPVENFHKQIFDCLMDLLRIHPELFIEKIQSSRQNFINQKALDQLLIAAQNSLKDKTSGIKKNES